MFASILGGVFGDAVGSLLSGVASAIGSASGRILAAVGSSLANNTQITVGQRYAALLVLDAKITALLGVIAILFAAARTALSRDAAKLGGDLVRIFVAIISTFVLVAALPLVEGVVHELSTIVASTFSHNGKQVGESLAGLGVTGGALMAEFGPIILIAVAGVLLLGGLTLWAILVVAQMLAYICAFFLPLALVVGPKLGRKVAELLAASVVMPFVVTAVLAVGFAVLGDGTSTGTVLEHLLGGAALIGIACLSPLTVIKLLHSGSVQQLKHPTDSLQHAASRVGPASSAGASHAASGGSASGAAAQGAAAAGTGGLSLVAGAALGAAGHAKQQATSAAQPSGQPSSGGSTNGHQPPPAASPAPPSPGPSAPSAPSGASAPPPAANVPPRSPQ